MAANEVLTIQPIAPVSVAAGGRTEARIALVIAHGYHVQANPAGDEFLIPLRLDLRARGGVQPGKPAYPQGRPYRLPGADKDWMTYEGTVEIVVPLEAASSARPGDHLLRGLLRYQACDDRRCLFPASLSVALPARVVGGPG